MGNCTSTVKRRQKEYKCAAFKNATVLDNKQLSPLPLTILSNQRPHSLLITSDLQTSIVTDSNSLIQLYSSNTNNNNNNNNLSIQTCMSSSSSSTSQKQPRIPVTKSRLPVYQSSTGSNRTKPTPTSIGTTNPPNVNSAMTTNNRTPTRFGFIPRPTAPGLQQAQASTLLARSRSISPSSTASVNSSSSSSTTSQRMNKTQTSSKTTANPPVLKSKLPPSPQRHQETSKSTTNRPRSNISSTVTPPLPPTKTDMNTVRDRYKIQTRMGFFTRRTTGVNSLKATITESAVIKEENNEQSTENPNEHVRNDSAYGSITSPSNPPPCGQISQINRQRQRNSSTISSSSLLSDVLNQEMSLDDDNCSLKSDDLLCDYDDTLTLDSTSKNDGGDTSSSNSVSVESNKKPTMITTVPTKKTNVQKDSHRSSVPSKVNDNLRESLHELTKLSTQMDSTGDNEQHRNRLLSRSVSLKPPASSLPPREDAEQITMDIESYRQVLKDVMVVKTVLHQLDRLLKHSDGANMTDSMIGSFHESMITSRHYSSSGIDGNARNSIDENSTYEDLMKEVLILRKERDQDKQTIKLLQEQMYKYSSQTNDS